MEQLTDVVRQVAEALCPCVATLGRCCSCANQTSLQLPLHQEDCGCQGTGLRWPTLSREKCNRTGHERSRMKVDGTGYGDWPCCYCHELEISHKPDVTLEKVIDEARKVGIVELTCFMTDAAIMTIDGEPVEHITSTTPLEAACAALLATEAG